MIRIRQNLFRLIFTGLVTLILAAPVISPIPNRLITEDAAVPAAVIACSTGSSGSCSGA